MIPQKCIAGQYFARKKREISPYRVPWWAYNYANAAGKGAVFKWLLKIITQLWPLVIGLTISGQFFNPWVAEPKPIPPCTCSFLCALNKLQIVACNFDWFIMFVCSCVLVFSGLIWKLFYLAKHQTMLMCLSETLPTTRSNFFFALTTLPPCTYWCKNPTRGTQRQLVFHSYKHIKLFG